VEQNNNHKKEGLAMRKRVTNNSINFNRKVVSIGIDVHKLSWRVTAMVEGVAVKAVTIKPSYSVLKKVLSQFKGARIRVAYEAGPAGFNLYDELRADHIDCIVVPPSLIPVESGNRVKTDKKDSTKLAHYLENNLLKRVWVLSKQERAHRQLLRTRRQISNHRSNVMRQIKSLLLFHGIQYPYEGPQIWTKTFVKWLRSIDGDEYIVHSLNVLVDLYEYLTHQVKELTEEVTKLARTEKYAHRVQLLKSIPGIGVLSAIEILVELQDVSRFTSADKLSAYIGVTPSQYSSGERVRMGNITHLGNHRVRTILVESSWTLIRKDPALYKVYESIKNRRGAKRAIIAISRKLVMRIRRILLDGTSYKINHSLAA
jgi:transposase